MSYTTISDDQVDVNSPFDTDLAGALRDNIKALRYQLFGVDIPERSVSNNEEVVSTFSVYIPDYPDESGTTYSIIAEVLLRTSDAAETASFYFYDQDSATTSNDAETTSTSYVSVTCSIEFTDSWRGTVKDFRAEIFASAAGTTYVKAPDRVSWRIYY